MSYASKYYDPVKAHEYYMQHRKLKDRRKTSDLNEEGRDAWADAKNSVTEDKKTEKEAKLSKPPKK